MGLLQTHREEDYNRILMFSSYENTAIWEGWASFFTHFFFPVYTVGGKLFDTIV